MIHLTTAERIEYADFLHWKSDLYRKRIGWLSVMGLNQKSYLFDAIALITIGFSMIIGITVYTVPRIGAPESVFEFIIIFWCVCILAKYKVSCGLCFCQEYAKSVCLLSLAGFSLYNFFNNLVFERLSHYTKHRGYSGIAMLNMFALKNNQTSRYVVADFNFDSKSPHAFVEFRFGGIWWVLDPLDDHIPLQTRLAHTMRYRVKLRYSIKYAEFWEFPAIKEFYNAINCSRAESGPGGMPFFYQMDAWGQLALNHATTVDEPRADRPVTREVLEEYFNEPARLYPSRRVLLEASHTSSVITYKTVDNGRE